MIVDPATHVHPGGGSGVTVADTPTLDLTLTGAELTGNVLPCGIDHGALADLSADDHPQYLNTTRHAAIDHTGIPGCGGGGGAPTIPVLDADPVSPTVPQCWTLRTPVLLDGVMIDYAYQFCQCVAAGRIVRTAMS
jgi:hypothetical protein